MINTQVERRIKPVTRGIVKASDVFGRFKRERRHEVRQPDIQGQTYVEQVKRTREMLRSLAPEKALEVIEFHKGLNLFQALALVQRGGKLIVPNDIHDRILMKTTDKESLSQNYPVWTGTLVIYEKPDKPFGEQVVFSWEDIRTAINYSISFKVPKQFRGKTNCALVIEHPDFELVEVGKNNFEIPRISKNHDRRSRQYELKPIKGARIKLIENFPKKLVGWYNKDPETKIPQGEPVSKSDKARYLCRLDSAYLGPIVRGFDFYDKKYVGLYNWPSFGFGVAFIGLGEAASKEG